MPWRGPDEFADWPTLGYQVANMIQQTCAIPDGDLRGENYILTDEMLRFLLHFYRLDPETGRFVYFRGAQLVRPQKWGKGPFSAAWVCAEAQGPVLFDRWAEKDGVDRWGHPYKEGDPLGRAWPTPLIQITAVSEDQTANVWRALVPMIELGDLQAEIPDTGETRINLPGGGRIQPVTSSARSRLGARITAAVQDESHDWTVSNGGRKLADTQRRNLAGMSGRFLETTNAWDPLDESVAQQTAESNEPGVYRDDVDPGPGSIRNKRERRACMRRVYGDSMKAPADAPWKPWVDPDRIDGEIEALLLHDPAQAERFFLNRKRAEQGAAFDIVRWGELANAEVVVADKSVITIGVDGARFDDALGIVATDVDQGHQFVLGVWEKPASAGDDYEHNLEEADGVMVEAFERFTVVRTYVDPQKIEILLDRWQGRWGDKVVKEWLTYRPTPIAHAVRNFVSAVTAGDLTHDGDGDFGRHIANARKQKLRVFDEERRQMFTLSKDRPGSPRKIDLAMAAVLSWEARGDAVAAGETKKKRSFRTASFGA